MPAFNKHQRFTLQREGWRREGWRAKAEQEVKVVTNTPKVLPLGMKSGCPIMVGDISLPFLPLALHTGVRVYGPHWGGSTD